MKPFLKYKPVARLIETTKNLVFAGNSPHKLSLAITLGMLFGVFPFLGVTTVLLLVIAILLKLNMVVIQLSNYLVYPIQLLLYMPFLKAGKFLGNLQSITLSNVFTNMKENWIEGIQKLWLLHIWAIFAWFLMALPTGYLLYYLLKAWIKRLKIRFDQAAKIHTHDQ
jgi:uncharacterized protein (DUF2062 family)